MRIPFRPPPYLASHVLLSADAPDINREEAMLFPYVRLPLNLGLAIGVFWCVCVPGMAQGQDGTAPTRLTERMVEMDGHAMRVATAGLETRRPGEPVVVFENGATSPLEAWGDVPARVAAFAPVVAYDRATLGQSEWDGEIGTPSHVTARLWALLRTLEVQPPYVLVGWSWGGDLIRYHAGSHPEDIAGLVHVDPAGHSAAAALAVLRAIGLGEDAYEADVASMEGALPSIPEAWQADVKAINQLYAYRAEPEYGTVPPVPTAVLLSGKRRPPSPDELEAFGEPPYDMQVHFQAKLRDKIRRLSEWTLQDAIAVFELNVREYPDAWNPHDSLGDAYRAAGETEKAISSYRRSLELNPDSPSAAKLRQLEG